MKYERPTVVEGLFNRVFGLLVRAGIGLRHNVLLQVRGRKSGRIYSEVDPWTAEALASLPVFDPNWIDPPEAKRKKCANSTCPS